MKKTINLTLFAIISLPMAPVQADEASLHSLISQHAAAYNIPEALIHRIVRRESNYNPRAVGRGGALGLMQIKHATARGMGYAGSASGLLDANTNLTYGVRYLAGAYRVASGNQDRAVSYYAGGYYYVAKRRGMTMEAAQRPASPVKVVAEREVPTTGSIQQDAQVASTSAGLDRDFLDPR